jgi:7-cyano-7-deazaguanine synthase
VLIFIETEPNSGRQGQAFDALVQQVKPYRSHRVPMHFLASPGKDARPETQADPRSVDGAVARLVDLMPIVGCGLRYAMQYNAVALYLGTRAGPDGPDLARATEFVQIWSEMVQLTCERPGLEVLAPLLEMEPWQVVDLGAQVSAPLALSWSCEKRAGDPCGECAGCRQRDAAFQRSGRPDPVKVPTKSAI